MDDYLGKVGFPFSLFSFCSCLYNNAAKIFGAGGVLRRRLEKLEGKVIYTTRGKSCVYRASRVGVFFEKKVSSREDCAEELSVNYNSCPIMV